MYTEDQKTSWKTVANAQGIVCVVCLEPPALQRRGAFYDTGLCRYCAAELEVEAPANPHLDRRPGLA
jgi:hypothetical protein